MFDDREVTGGMNTKKVMGICSNHENARSQEKIAETITQIAEEISDRKSGDNGGVTHAQSTTGLPSSCSFDRTCRFIP